MIHRNKNIYTEKHVIINKFVNNLAVIKSSKKKGLVNKKNNLVTNIKYDKIITLKKYGNNIFKYYYAVKIKSKWGLLDNNGKCICECKYDRISGFYSNSIALMVCVDEKYGLIDRSGKEIIPCQYDNIELIKSDLIIIKLNDKFGLIDYKNNIIVEPIYNNIYRVYHPSFDGYYVYTDNKIGLTNKLGRIILEPIYDYITFMDDNIEIRINIDGQYYYGYSNFRGKIIIPCLYKNEEILKVYESYIFNKKRVEKIKSFLSLQ